MSESRENAEPLGEHGATVCATAAAAKDMSATYLTLRPGGSRASV